MDKYRLVERRTIQLSESLAMGDNEGDSTPLNELRITQEGRPRAYITKVMNILTTKKFNGEMDGPVMRMVVLEAIGKAVNKSVSIAETLRRKIPLHQITHLKICEIVEVYAPIEEGLDLVEAKRFISCMFITLSLDPLDTTDIGYQPPISPEEIQLGDTRDM